MINKKIIYHIVFFFVLVLKGLAVFSQTVGVRADRDRILIGEKISYELLVSMPSSGYSVNFALPDSIEHFEIIEKSGFDTISQQGSFSVHQKIIFTSFDSGRFAIPSFPVTLSKNGVFKKYQTDSLPMFIGYSPMDSSGQLRDIKPLMNVVEKDYFWYYVAGAILTAIIIFLLLYSYFKNRKRKPKPLYQSGVSPLNEAMSAMKDLMQYDLSNPAEIRKYHTALIIIFKRYYSRKRQADVTTLTTGNFLILLKQDGIDINDLTGVSEIMRMSDAVKFAKYLPSVSDSEGVLVKMKHVINNIDQATTLKAK